MITTILRNRLQLLCLSSATIFALAGCSTTPTPSTTTTATASVVPVSPGRGMWFWESSAQMAIVATPSAQAQAIANLKAWNVTSLYGSYESQISSNPAAVRAWNANLAANGIASYVLASSGSFFLPEQWPTTQAWIETNFLSFNAASTPGQGFVGLAFDVEPASFTGNTTRASWNAATPAVRRTYLTYFSNMLQSARTLLSDNGAGNALIQTYLVTWWSNLTGSILWANQADQTQWYAQLAQICDRISVEQYDTNSTTSIISGFQTNNALLNGKSRVGLNSADTQWTSVAQFWQGVTTTESSTSTFVDIEDYDTTTSN